MKGTSVQVHCVHPGHIGTNILASAKVNPSEDNDEKKGMFARPNATQEEQGEAFRQNGMHASQAAQIILNGVRKRRSRICGLGRQAHRSRPAPNPHALR